MKKKIYFFIITLLLISTSLCSIIRPNEYPIDDSVSITLITNNGGRVAWYNGDEHELIAFDRIVDDETKDTEVYTMEPDGTNVQCVTCDSDIPKGFIGQPSWHPDGEYLIIQAENSNSWHKRYNHMSWGIDNDLWIIKKSGEDEEKIFDTSATLGNAALHPHFSKNGDKVVFSERFPQGEELPIYYNIGVKDSHNQWDGWQIHIADFNPDNTGTDILSNHKVLFPSMENGGFYETHSFMDNDTKIAYSHTEGGHAFVDDGYIVDIDSENISHIIQSSGTWEEHLSYSPSGNSYVYISSKVDPDWFYFTGSRANELRTELFMYKDGVTTQITNFNESAEPGIRVLTSDFDWDKTGKRIAVQVQRVGDEGTGSQIPPEIWMITFPEEQ